MQTSAGVPEWAQGITSALDEKMGFELLELTTERVVGRVPVEGNTQPMGLWHGGASGVLVETLGSLGSYAMATESGATAVGVELNVTHHRAVKQGWVQGVATPAHRGRQMTTWTVELSDEHGHRIATGRLTCMFLAQRG